MGSGFPKLVSFIDLIVLFTVTSTQKRNKRTNPTYKKFSVQEFISFNVVKIGSIIAHIPNMFSVFMFVQVSGHILSRFTMASVQIENFLSR